MDDKTILNTEMLPIGTILHDTYRIDSYLASGGFGKTYVATNLQFNEKVAIKEFFLKDVSYRGGDGMTVSISTSGGRSTFDSQLKKFKVEAQRLRKLDNRHIVKVHDLFDANDTSYYVMDFIDGESLSARLKRLHHPLTVVETENIFKQVLDALNATQNANPPLLHLDINPRNIMIDKQGKVTLIDFGASKQLDPEGGATAFSAVAMSKHYAPLEQMEGNPKKFGPWTDFYALGATMYNLLANAVPPLPTDIAEDNTPDKHLILPFPTAVPRKVRSIVLWLMQTNRTERPQSVSEIISRLNNIETDATEVDTVELEKLQRAKAESETKRKATEEAREKTEAETRKKSERSGRGGELLQREKQYRKMMARCPQPMPIIIPIKQYA